ncbi:MAG: class III signal peptide-containing protein [Candidatus Diapherotrites archaeon]|nr:class III signal peptide-containing protein [Candidatus Diapherotrites archaeon]
MKNVNTKKGQGALEYLLLIGGAVLIAAIVLTLLSNLGQQSSATTTTRVAATQCEPLPQDKCENPNWSDFDATNNADGVKVADCHWDIAINRCDLGPPVLQ